ncbi:MAG: DUF4834 family protein [Bacteroidetes bacterium]|nr:DUF4834 family protein [Bacteroidota bacterium]
MQDFLLTLVVIFVLFRIFRNSTKPSSSNFNFTQNNFNNHSKKPQGEVTVESIPENKSRNKPSNNGDYVDYEEVK